MATVKAFFLLPRKDNDGRDLTTEIDEVEHEVFIRFDGWTREGSVTGTFRMPDGSQKVDVSERYMVFLEESRLGELEQILKDFKGKTSQEAIYLEIQRDAEIRLI